MKTMIMVIVLITTLFMITGQVLAATLVVADFNSGEKPNNIKGDFGAWNRDENDKTQYCKITFNPITVHDAKGFSLQIDYDVDSPNPAYNGFWMNLENQDISKYDKLTFWIKGDAKTGFSPKIKLELKNAKGEVGSHSVATITKDWQEISIPLKQFTGLSDLTSMKEIVIIFDDITCAGRKNGTIYIDDIAFVK